MFLEPECEITVPQLYEEIGQNEQLVLLDVREPHEFEFCKIDNSRLIPMGQLEGRLNELDRQSNIVVICRTGVRSAAVTRFLIDSGFSRVRNLVGGVMAWADLIDPSMPRY